MNQVVAELLPGLMLVLPFVLGASELLGQPRSAGGRRLLHHLGVRAYLALALVCAAWPVFVPGHPGLAPLRVDWVPALGFELGWQLSPVWALLLGVVALAWARLADDASSATRTASAFMQFALGSTVAATDLLTSVGSLALLGLTGLLALVGEGSRGEAGLRSIGRRFASEWAVALGAGLTLLVSVGLATNAAEHSSWTFGWAELPSFVFPAGVQQQSVLLLLLCIAPYCGLFPFGGGFSLIGDGLERTAAAQWSIVAPIAAASVWLTGVRALAPRMSAELAFPLIVFFALSALVRVLIAHGRASHDSDEAPFGAPRGGAGRFVLLPFLLAPALLTTGTPWGIYAMWLAVLAHATNQLLALESSTLGEYLRAGAPGSATFAAWMATWMAMAQSVATLEGHAAVLLGPLLALPVLLGWAAILVVEREPRGGTMHSSAAWRVAAVVCALGGLFPGAMLARLAPHELMRADEFTLTRCSDLELMDLRRPRLRSELRVNCAKPRDELEAAFRGEVPVAPPVMTIELEGEMP